VDEDRARGVHAREVRVRRDDDRVEPSLGSLDDAFAPLVRAWIGVHDDDLPAGELERRGVDPREADLEHPARAVAQQFEDPRRNGSGQSGRQPNHGATLSWSHRGAACAAENTPVEPDPGHAGEGSVIPVPRALTIAGSDSGGGAGIQADLKAFAAAGVHGTSAIVALTAQNTVGVSGVHEVPPAFVRAQLEAVFEDIGADAAKTGMLFSRAIIEAVADFLDEHRVPLVVDPVMVASSGARLLEEDAVGALVERLFPRATVVTPNLLEAQALVPGVDPSNRLLLSEGLVALGAPAAIVTGGHGDEAVDHLFDGREHHEIPVERLDRASTHGAGCTHSATLAALLARGLPLLDAARGAAEAATRAVRQGLTDIGAGDGPVDILGVANR